MVGTQMNVFGVLLGYLFPIIFVDSYTDGDPLNEAQIKSYKHQIYKMLLTVAIIAIVITALTIFTFRERPGAKIFKSNDAVHEEEKNHVEKPLMEQFRLCMQNKTFVFTALNSICLMIHLYILTTVVG